jgi:glycosyltransferase involved in cell wall biosynthesis
MKVAVVTPTIGGEQLDKCLQSVHNQTYENLTHYIFVDGQQYYNDVQKSLSKIKDTSKIKLITLEENVGKGWYGHRVYAACSFLVNADIICYLDSDNWYEENHVETIVSKINEGFDWVYSLRKIYDKDANYICEDNCESLGKWPIFFDTEAFHIDTSCFGVRRDIAVAIGHAWYGQWGADRKFFTNIKKYFPKFECTKEYTVAYRLDGNANSVKREFFEVGNKEQLLQYNDKLPWKEK